jgi:hypothetical protein
MSKRHKNRFKQALDAKREALASAAKQPKQELAPGPAVVTEEAGAGGMDKEE